MYTIIDKKETITTTGGNVLTVIKPCYYVKHTKWTSFFKQDHSGTFERRKFKKLLSKPRSMVALCKLINVLTRTPVNSAPARAVDTSVFIVNGALINIQLVTCSNR